MTTEHKLGDAPIDPQFRDLMNAIGKTIDEILNGVKAGPKSTGFILMVFPFTDHDGRCNYISNAQQDDVVILLKEQLARFEGQPEATGRA